MQRRPIIALGPHSWRGPWSGRQQILSRLARRGWPVIYSCGPLTWWDRGTAKWNETHWLSNIEPSDGVMVDHPGLSLASWPKLDPWRRCARRLHGRSLRKRHRQDGILFLFHPSFWDYVEAVDWKRVAYHAYDTYSAIPGWRPEMAEMERALVRRADLLLATSKAIARDLPEPGPTKAIEFNNGVDFDHFSQGASMPAPEDLAAVPSPRLGVVGRITPKIDFSLVADIAAAKPDWHWAFVGPIILPAGTENEAEAIARVGLERCKAMNNIHFLGNKSHTELPAYMAHMDVNVMSYRVDGGWWVAGYPLRMHECLAVGRPVVSAALETIRIFDSVVDVVDSTNGVTGWTDALERAIEDGGIGSPEQRRETARRNDWNARIDQLEPLLLELQG